MPILGVKNVLRHLIKLLRSISESGNVGFENVNIRSVGAKAKCGAPGLNGTFNLVAPFFIGGTNTADLVNIQRPANSCNGRRGGVRSVNLLGPVTVDRLSKQWQQGTDLFEFTNNISG